jgi:polysaccharide pyruvyl transferase WcaK-like protein
VQHASEDLQARLSAAKARGTLQAVDQSRLVVMGGGGRLGRGGILPTVQEHEKFEYYWRLAWYCRVRRKPLYVLGVGAGPVTTKPSRRRVRDIAAIARTLVVRDEASRDALLEVAPRVCGKVRVLADPAFSVDYDALRRSRDVFEVPAPCLGVNLCVVRGFERGLAPQQAATELIDTVQEMVRTGVVRSVIWFSTTQSGNELVWACRGAQALPQCSRLVFYDRDPWQWIRHLGACHAFIGMKLHSTMFAAGMGVPVLGVGFHPKVGRFYRDVGATAHYRSLEELHPGDLRPFILGAYPGAPQLNRSPAWQRLRSNAQRLFEVIPACTN